jgi:hypothetical protein
MLTIRRDQMAALDRPALAAFEAEMVTHCNVFSPPLCKVLGDEQLRLVIRQAIERARSHGFTNRGPVRLFIELTLLYGSAFDTDPQYPWAGEILRSHERRSQMERAEQLYAKTLEYLANVAGPDDAFTRQALERIVELTQQPPQISQANFISSMLLQVQRVHPEKAAYTGDSALESLLQEGVLEAVAHDMTAAHSKALFCVLMFAFGHGCTSDPLYPWIAATLQDDRLSDPATRAKRLEKKATTWLHHVIAALAEDSPS